MTKEELRDYVEEQRSLNMIPYHVYSTIIEGINELEQEPKKFYDKGYSDGMRALAVHIELCKEEQEPTTKNDLGVDYISRAQAQTKLEMNASRYTIARERGGMGQVEWSDQLIKVSDAVDIIRDLPSVTPQEPKTDELVGNSEELDCISRKAVLELVADMDLSMGQVVKGIHALPSVKQELIKINQDCNQDSTKSEVKQ